MAEHPTPQQVASVLQKGMNLRPDVKKATVKVDPNYHPNMLLVDVSFYTGNTGKDIETRYEKCLDGRTCGEIIDEWIGPLPAPVKARNILNLSLIHI